MNRKLSFLNMEVPKKNKVDSTVFKNSTFSGICINTFFIILIMTCVVYTLRFAGLPDWTKFHNTLSYF